MSKLKSRLLIQKSKGPALLAKVSRLFAILLLVILIAGNTPLVVLAQSSGSQQSKTTVKTIAKEPSFLQKLFSFLTAPFKFRIATKSNVAPKKVAINNVAPVKKPAPSPVPTPIATPKPSPKPTVLAVSAANTVTTVIAKALPAGTTFIDLIGKTIIDSFGNVYPSGAGLAQTNKPTLGTTTNKYYGLYLSNFNVDKAGGITTVLGGGIVKSSSKGVLSSSAVDINSGDITGTLQAGNGGTGQTTYTVGDILYSATGGTLSRLAIGTASQYLTVSSGAPAWSSSLSVTSTSLADGTAATPALNFTSDTDSGLWRIGANHIALTTAGSALSGISINGSGNVGIGATGAAASLEVNGNAMIGYASGASGPNMANSLAVSGNVGIGTSTHAAGYELDVNGSIWAENSLAVGSGGLTIYTSGGNVGIGNTVPNATLSIQGNVGIGYTGGSQALPSNGLAVFGNVGIGVTTANSKLAIAGGAVLGTGYAGMVAPTNGLLVQGLVGIGNTAPGNTLAVNGGLNLGTFGSVTGPTNGLAVSGNIGIGVSTPNSLLAVNGGGVFGNGYSGMVAPTNGLLVQGLVGIGTTAPGAALGVAGAGLFGANFANVLAPANGLAVQGNVGIGVSTANSLLTVNGGAVIGTSYNLVAPTNGLLVQGLVGIGNTAPGNTLAVNGGLNLGTFASDTGITNGLVVSGNVGIGVTTAKANLAIAGNAVIGAGYAGMLAPANGLAVEGLVGLGTTSPADQLHLIGQFRIDRDSSVANQGCIRYGDNNELQYSQDCVTFTNFSNIGVGSSVGGGWNDSGTNINLINSTDNVGIGFSAAGTAKLGINGNVGIGTTAPLSALSVIGGAVFGNNYGSLTAPASGLLVQGLVGIGNTAPGNTLAVTGGVNIGTYGTANGPSNGLAVSGNLGIGTTTPNSALSIVGGQVIGTGYGSLTAPTSGLLVQGLVGIGNTAPGNTFTVTGGVNIGTYGTANGPSNGLAVSGNLGIGTTTPNSALSIVGGQVIGTGYGSLTAPTSGLLVQGLVGIGNTAPGNTLAVNGGLNLGTFASATGPSNGLAVSGNVGIGVTTANNALQVLGAGLFSGSWGGATVPTNGLVVEGSVGIGISVPSQLFQIGTAGNSLVFTSTGTLGIGVTTPLNTLDIIGSAQIRTAGAATFAVTSSNRVGVGTTAPGGTFSVSGNTTLGTFSNTAGPANGLAVSGNVGIGVTTANNALQVAGAAVFSNTWGGAVAPTNGLIVEGRTGIGTSAPSQALQVGTGLAFDSTNNRLGVGTTSPIATFNVWGSGSAASAIFQNGNVGIGGTATGFNTLQVTGSIGIGTTYGPGTYSLDVAGKVRATGYFGLCGTGTDATTCNQDVAEIYPSTEDVAAGDLVAIDLANQKYVKKSAGAYDIKLMGIVSTSPGLILGIDGQNVALGAEASGYPENADPRLPAVALSGKVPVKVSTENGAINIGDYLTSSSVPGVAMKATKAGPVVGQALAAYDSQGVGKVLVFVRLGYYNGASLEDTLSSLTTGLDVVGSQSAALNFAQAVLARLISQQSTVGNMSDISLDRVAAGVEIITPKVTADTIILRSLQPLEGENMLLTLAADQKFVIQSTDKDTAITFDSQGNAYFKGSVVATAIKADQIEGLKIMTNELVAGQVSALNEYLKSVKQASASAQTASIDTGSLAKLGTDGGLTVSGPAQFKAASIFNAVADFIAGVVFRGDVSFLGRPTFNKDTAGLAIVQSGADSVRVNFDRAYAQTPFVNITVTNADDVAQSQILNGEVRYVVTALSTSGFTIKINKAAPGTISFSWSAIAVSNSQVSSSTGAAAPTPAPTASPTAAPSAEPTAAPTASPTAAPSAEPTAAPTAAPEVTATPTPTPTPAT